MLLSVAAAFFAALLHEDLGILTASFVVSERDVPFALALGVVYSGVLSNNLSVYSVGVLARCVPALHRRLMSVRVERLGCKLHARAVPAVLLCRFAPGLVLPTFFGCGWFGVSFSRFAPAAAVAAGAYVSTLFTLVVVFGRMALQRFSGSAWLVPAVAIGVTIVLAARRRLGRSERNR